MKILFITSFYSALRKSIFSDKWDPTGMPAIVKLFEGLQSENITFDNVFVDSDTTETKIIELNNRKFDNKMYLLNLSKKLNIRFLRNIGNSINSLYIYKIVQRLLRKIKYDIIYVDRANVVIGAMLALLGYKVILRLHGVTTYFDRYKKWVCRFYNPLKIISYKAPFAYIICSEDGTPGKQFLENFSRHNVPKIILINGVDKNNYNKSDNITRDNLSILKEVPIFLFLGRLSKDKGLMELLDSIILLKKIKTKFNVIIVGGGELLNYAKNVIEKNNLSNVILTGAIPHSDVYKYLNISDVYISLNKLGNLSNTVLEAVNAEKCIITLKKSNSSLRDLSTYNFFKNDVIYINRTKIVYELSKVINDLIINPQRISRYKNKMKTHKVKLITWSERIEKEIQIMMDFVN